MPRPARARLGVTLLEVLIALFIFMVGIVGVLAAMPTGVNSAEWVIFQDSAIHLAHSKFSEFRRDRADPFTDLVDGSGYMPSAVGGLNTPGVQENKNGNPGDWRDFGHKPGEAYYYFDDIERYEWKLELEEVTANSYGSTQPAGITAPTGAHYAPGTGGSGVRVQRVTVIVHMKGLSRELRFTQYMTPYGRL
ncbi:MAG: prepilin-type N-terminal cleavage/methylation domain-containing protein [Planctomycetota bacterium]|nr:prepilin-type N-terminal cleavage/methylation domain-containing protein [Planctomycetota bacterium]